MDIAKHRTGTMRSGDVALFYRAFGQRGATPILIVHGLSYFSHDWIDIAGVLSADREVVAMDMRGFGDSGWSVAKNYGVGDFSTDIINLIDHLGWKSVILMGHSMGGRNCTWCAAENPTRVDRLVLVDYSPQNAPAGSNRVATTVANVPDRFATMEDGIGYFGEDADDPKIRARYEAYLWKLDDGYIIRRDSFHRDRFRRILAGEGGNDGPDMWDALARVQCPILNVRGTRSDVFAPETTEQLKSINANVTLVEVDASHDVAGDAPDALVAEVTAFVG